MGILAALLNYSHLLNGEIKQSSQRKRGNAELKIAHLMLSFRP